VKVAAVELLSPRNRVVQAVVRVGDSPEDEIGLIGELGSTKGEVQPCARVENDDAVLWIEPRSTGLISYPGSFASERHR
jgi:hypothetical protein